MKIRLIALGKTEEKYIAEGMETYLKRIKQFIPLTFDALQVKSAAAAAQKKAEAEAVLSKLKPDDYLILLDEKGKSLTSVEFSTLIQQTQNRSTKQLVFLIGGAYGFEETVYARANYKLSLSNMTFPHQLVRLIFAEQLYRAYSILHNKPYHHS